MTLSLRRRQAFAAAGLLLSAGRSAAAEDAPEQPSPTPMLVPNTTGHLAAVRAVAVSPDGAMIATGGLDRSVRIWDGSTRRWLRTWRPPLGVGATGVVDSLAFSHDGRWLLAGAVDWRARRGILYFVEAATGELRRIISSPPRSVSRFPRLAASPAGPLVAVAAESQGMLLLRYSPDLSQIVPTPEAGADPLVTVAFSASGRRLVSATQGGQLRLSVIDDLKSGPASALPRPLPGQPLSVAMSPDDRFIAAGLIDRRQVAVVDLVEGTVRMLEPPASFGPGNLGAVAWAMGDDGAYWLFAAGTIQSASGSNLMFAWRGGKAGPALMVEMAQDSVDDLAAHPKGGVVFGSSDGSWGWVTTAGKGRRLDVVATNSERLDFRDAPKRRWGIDLAGGVVEFRALQHGQPALRFDLARLQLEEAGAPRADVRTVRPARSIALPTDLRRDGERMTASDTAPQTDRVLLGGLENLVLLDRDGRELARRAITAPAWAVAFSGDGRLVVAAHGDGTLRWYGLDEKALLNELGGLFVHVDRRRWVAWRNDGRFTCSELGGDTLVGVHENGRFQTEKPSALASRWSSIDQQHRQLYDPAAIADLLRPGPHWTVKAGVAGAPLLAEADPVPGLRVLQACAAADLPGADRRSRAARVVAGEAERDPAPDGQCQDLPAAASGQAASLEVLPGTAAIRVRLDLGDAKQPVLVDAFVNGINVGRTLHRPGSAVETLVPIQPSQATVEFRAYGRAGNFTRTAPLLVVQREAPQKLSRLHVLAVGIDRYTGTVPPLRFAAADAATFAGTMERVVPRAYTNLSHPQLLRNEQATLVGVEEAMLGIIERAAPDDAVMIYLSGHGVSANGNYAFVTADVTDAVAANDRGDGCLRAERLIELLSNVRAARTMLLVDTCFANALDLRLSGRLGHDTGRLVLTASGFNQEALDGYNGSNGVFGYAVKEGLTELPAPHNGVLDALELCRHVRERVEILARTRGHDQKAHLQASGEVLAFPVAESR